MLVIHTIARALAAAAAAALATTTLVAAAAQPAGAQERLLFRWQGRVDREASLTMRGSRVATPGAWPGAGPRGDLRVGSALPQADGVVRLRVERGRGAVDVVEQPSPRNDYTAVVRVRDDQPGAGDYRVTAYWLPVRGDVASGGGWGDWGDDDGRWDRGDRGDRADRRRDRDERRRDRERARDRGRGRDRDARQAERRRDRDDDDRDNRRGRDGWGWGARDDRRDSGSGALRWSGRVDAVQEIRIRGRRVDSYTVSGDRASDVRSQVRGSLPAREAYVRVRQADGRGQIAVVQQPSARNDYTAVLRVVDRQPGADYYTVEATW